LDPTWLRGGTAYKVTEDHTEEAVSVAIVPLTIPLYGGLGSIAFTHIMGVLPAGMGIDFIISGAIEAIQQSGLI
jgi:small neutral amino acid transporter SnatA (MarC family)